MELTESLYILYTPTTACPEGLVAGCVVPRAAVRILRFHSIAIRVRNMLV